MKTLIFILIVAAFVVQSPVVFAKGQSGPASIKTIDAEREFELEIERNDVGDIKDQQTVAEDEAQHQEQLERQERQQLQDLQQQKARVARKAKTLIASAELRRIKAEKAVAKYDAEISRLQSQITALQKHMTQLEAQAEDAEGLAAEEREELKQYRQERHDLLKRLHHKRSPAASSKLKNKDLEAYHQALESGDDF